jgi:hypothetical protein
MVAPAVFQTQGQAAHIDHMLGALVVTVAIVAFAEVTRAARFINLALALGIIVLPWLLGGGTPSGPLPGQPNRITARPTTERLLKDFHRIALVVIRQGQQLHRYLTPLSTLQKDILRLMSCAANLYRRLIIDSG